MDVCMYVWYNLVKKQTQQTKKKTLVGNDKGTHNYGKQSGFLAPFLGHFSR